MCKVKLTLQIKRIGIESSEVNFNNPPFLFCYKEDVKSMNIVAETFEGDINCFVFPIHAAIAHNQSNINYDLIINGQKVKMFKSEKEITLAQQGQGQEDVIVFEVIYK